MAQPLRRSTGVLSALVVLVVAALLLALRLTASCSQTSTLRNSVRLAPADGLEERLMQRLGELEQLVAGGGRGSTRGGGPIDGGAAAADSGAGARASRELVENTAWHVNASNALSSWRTGMFANVAKQRAAYRGEPPAFSRYDMFMPIVQCPKEAGGLKRLGGDGDGGKWLCMADRLKNKKDCVIYSVGSLGQYDFEIAMLNATVCQIHTFDCTYNGTSQNAKRHVYHNICVGDKTETRNSSAGPLQFMTLEEIIKTNRHSVVDLLKVDIEGYEFEMVSGFRMNQSCHFPIQIAMEVHYNHLHQLMGVVGGGAVSLAKQERIWPMNDYMSQSDLAVFFGHIADLGYAPVSREDNHWSFDGCCVEFTFMRVERPANCPEM